MITVNKLSALALLLSVFVGGCAAQADAESDGNDDGASSEDALTSLAKSEVVGTLKASWYAEEAAAPAGQDKATYRAFAFDAVANQKLTAYVVTNNETDPIAYVLDSHFKELKRNDNRDATVKDAAIAFTPPATGTYYLAFRTKERTAATVMARIVDDELGGGLRTRTFVDGWPVRQPRSGEDQYSYEHNKHAVNVSAAVKAGATSIINSSGCPADPFQPGAGLSIPDGATFTVDPVARTISLPGGNVGGGAQIGSDGSFEFDSGTDRWGFKRASGRVAAGGFVIISHVETMDCSTNSDGRNVHNARRLDDAIGAADPNYR
jgi:hypothetical protein